MKKEELLFHIQKHKNNGETYAIHTWNDSWR